MSRVKGPNSALTEFLRSQGIDANEIRRRHEQRIRDEEDEAEGDGPDGVDAEEVKEELIENDDGIAGDDEEISRIAEAAASKRRADYNADHDGTAICASCHSRFTITVYSKPAPNTDNEFLCRACSNNMRPKTPKTKEKAANNKKRKKMAAELLDLKFLTPPSLQDLCITKAAEHIDSITELGDLNVTALNKISRILTKNRRLSSKTMQLFLRPSVTSLEFWDCSSISPETFNLIPALCPNLENLVLGMCGQLCGENLLRIAEISSLKSIHLDGAFMVRKDAWLDFIDLIGPKIKSLSIASIYRFDAEVLALLAESCVSLEHLALRSLCQLYDSTPFYMISSLIGLRYLEISDLEPEAWSDEALVQILNSVGSQLHTLIIKNPGDALSDRVIDAISQCCGSLTHLELVNITEISTNAVANMFNHWSDVKSNTGLQYLSLERCFSVGNRAVTAAIEHSGHSLVDLNINSLNKTEPQTIEKLASLPHLSKLDIGFVGQVNPRQIYKLSTSKSLTQVLAFGNIRISGMPLPTGIALLGTM